jgi:hypothetical protein
LTWINWSCASKAHKGQSILRRFLWSLQGDAIVIKDIIVNLGAGKSGKIVGDWAKTFIRDAQAASTTQAILPTLLLLPSRSAS